MRTFRISLIQQSILLSHLIVLNIGVLIIIYYINGSISFDFSLLFLELFLLVFSTIPTLCLHIQYYLKNRQAVFSIDCQSETLFYVQKNVSLHYHFNDIKKIERVASYGKGTGVYSFSEYRYYNIILNDDTKIVITCLMINDIEKTLKNLLKREIEKKFKLLAFISKS